MEKKAKKTNLLKIFLLKEKVFWPRTWGMHKKFPWLFKLTLFPVTLLFIAVFHYAFAFMHNAFESYLFFTDKDRFKVNLNKIELQMAS